MKITITASLTEEQIDILSIMKNYTPELNQSKWDFIRELYEWMISRDASYEYTRFAKRQREEAEQAEENAIREQVKASISSSI